MKLSESESMIQRIHKARLDSNDYPDIVACTRLVKQINKQIDKQLYIE